MQHYMKAKGRATNYWADGVTHARRGLVSECAGLDPKVRVPEPLRGLDWNAVGSLFLVGPRVLGPRLSAPESSQSSPQSRTQGSIPSTRLRLSLIVQRHALLFGQSHDKRLCARVQWLHTFSPLGREGPPKARQGVPAFHFSH